MNRTNQTDLRGALREVWETRPSRRSDERQVAGVAAAIGRRYDVDPTLVRIAFVVAAVAGVGALLYIGAWIALPEDPAAGPPAPRRGILVAGLALAAVGTVFGGTQGGSAPLLVGLGLLAALVLLHRNHPQSPAAAPQAAAGPAPAAPAGVSMRKDLGDGIDAPASPPSWDPLGAAPFAWDLPEPGPAAPAPPAPRRLPVTPVTLGVMLLATAGTSALLLATGTLGVATLPILFGVALGVVGLGLLVGSFLRAGRGLIPIALMLSALTWGLLAAPLDRVPAGGFGDLQVQPASVDQLQPLYQRTAGDVDLDLSRLQLAPVGADTSPVRTRVEVGAGDLRVVLPEDADVTFTGDVGVGELEVEGRHQSGPDLHLHTVDLGEDGVVSGRPLEIEVEMGAGHLEVDRG